MSGLQATLTEQQVELETALRDTAAGDRKALKSLVDRTSAKLFGICLRILGDREEAEDVLQEVYVTIWHRAGRFDPAKARAITWLATIARNRSIDRLRSGARLRLAAPMEEALDTPDEGMDGFELAATHEEHGRLALCLGELEGRTQQMIRVAFFEGRTYSELANGAGVPLGTVKSWIRRGLLRLRDCLQR